MALMEAVVRKEVSFMDGPLEIFLLLFPSHSLHVFIHCAVEKLELFTFWLFREHLSYILKEPEVNLRKLECKIHASCNHDVIRLVMGSIVL